MKLFKSSVALALAISMASSATAAQVKCVTEAESAAIFASVMPELIGGLRDRCRPHLPANAFLVSNSDTLISSYKKFADTRWPTAKVAFRKLAGEKATPDLPDELMRPLLSAFAGSELIKNVKVEDCNSVDRVIENLSPLPPENVSALFGIIIALTGGDDGFSICKT